MRQRDTLFGDLVLDLFLFNTQAFSLLDREITGSLSGYQLLTDTVKFILRGNDRSRILGAAAGHRTAAVNDITV